jgi:FlaG/FlaF family flagellin (archaellin)
MKANKKFTENDSAVSAVIGVILMVAITVAVGSTVFVYVSGLSGTQETGREGASVVGQNTDNQIKLVLTSGGKSYDDGYDLPKDVDIFVNGDKVEVYTSAAWETGGQILLGYNGTSWKEGSTVTNGNYEVTVVIKNSIVYDGTIKID